MGKYFIAQGKVTLKKMIQPDPYSNWSEMFWLPWIPASYKKLRSKLKKLGPGQHFLHYESIGPFCCHGNHSFKPICPKTICNQSPTPTMLHIKFDQDWPATLADIYV